MISFYFGFCSLRRTYFLIQVLLELVDKGNHVPWIIRHVPVEFYIVFTASVSVSSPAFFIFYSTHQLQISGQPAFGTNRIVLRESFHFFAPFFHLFAVG